MIEDRKASEAAGLDCPTCPTCSATNPAQYKFCGNCGSPLAVACPVCAAPNPAGQHFCMACTAPLVTPCPRCRTPNWTGQQFCGECGGPLVLATPVLAPASEVAVSDLRSGPAVSHIGPGDATASPGPAVVEERRLITALFCDLVGFTPLTESLDPEEVREIQTLYFNSMAQELHRFGGSVEKYAGDAVLALFGNPIAHEDDPERAVRCALAMQQAFGASVAQMARSEYGKEVALRIGVNTGEVISGAWDVEGKLDYSATGDALNTAARLQTAAEPGGVIVGPETMHLARRAIIFGPRQDLTLKGKSEPFPAYRVLGLREEIAERWETHGQRTLLVGRERELVLLMDVWARVQEGEGRIVTLTAEAGVGKSRLLTEAVERMARVAGTVILRGRCMSHGEGMSLHLVADLLRSMCHLREGAASERIRDQVRSTVDALLAPWDDETRDAAADVLGSVLGLPPGLSAVTYASPQVRRQTLIRSLQLLLSASSSYRPAVVVLEDLHWVDQASVEVLDAVLPALRERQAMVLATHRPGRTLPWEERDGHDGLPLEPLDGADALTLARAIVGHKNLDPALERQVTDRAGGNPFFVEELLRNMQESGALHERDGRLYLVPGAAEHLPSTLTELLLARLDQLDRASRSTAQLGSVIGRAFAVPVLSRIAEQSVERLQTPLNELERAEIAFPQNNSEQEYAFKHATIREVAYNALLLRRRRMLHAAAARAIIHLYPVEEQVDIIAYHFSQTREHAEAAHWLERSADRAASVFANGEAVERYREVLRRQDLIGASPADRSRVDEKLGRILRVVGEYDAALEVLDAALIAFEADGDPEGLRRVMAEIGRVHRARATADEGIERLNAFLAEQKETAPSSGLAALYVALARLYFSTSRYQEDFDAASRGSELAQIVGDIRVQAEAEMVRSPALYYLRGVEESLRIMEEAIPLAEAASDFEVLSILLSNASVIYRDTGQLERSLQLQERSVHITERTGDFANHAFALVAMGEITFLLGDWETALGYLRRAKDTVEAHGTSWFASYPPLQLGRVEVERGNFGIAAKYIGDAIALARGGQDAQPLILGPCFLAQMDLLQGNPESAVGRLQALLDSDGAEKEHSTMTVAYFYAAEAYLGCGNVAEAARLADLSIERLTEEKAVVELPIARRVAGMVAAAGGEYDRAAGIFADVAEAARAIKLPHAEACALYEHGLLCARTGDRMEGQRLLEDSLKIFTRLGARPYIERTRRALSGLFS